MRISVELVPRSAAEVLADAAVVRSVLPEANAFNIPDLLRFPLRSWEACSLTCKLLPDSIPHIRAMDVAPGEEVPLARALIDAELKEVLVVQGDPPRDLSRRTYPHSSTEVIRRFKKYHPSLRVYAAMDPYRQGFRAELEGLKRKLDAGADGFFTQPFFDLRLLEMWAEMLLGQDIFWGLSPVLGDRSKAYWETTNRIVFPRDFQPNFNWNLAFARSALSLLKSINSNVYFMPIRVDLAKYLAGIFEGT